MTTFLSEQVVATGHIDQDGEPMTPRHDRVDPFEGSHRAAREVFGVFGNVGHALLQMLDEVVSSFWNMQSFGHTQDIFPDSR